MTRSDDSEADDSPIPKRKKLGGKILRATGRKPTKRLDKMARGGTSANGKPHKFIQSMHMKKGALHEQLHVPQGEKIPEKKLEKAEHSSNPTLRKRAVLAETLKGFHKK